MRYLRAVAAVAAVAACVASGMVGLSGQEPTVVKEGILDLITLQVPRLPATPDTPVVIRRFSVEGTDLGTGAEGGKASRVAEAKKMLEDGPAMLAQQFVEELTKSKAFREVRVIAPEAPVPADAILVEGRIVKMDPGSRAKRYFGGFGAGKTTVAVEGSVKDAKGQTLATFAQQRHGSMGAFGGDTVGKLTDDSRTIGEDIAKFMAAWAAGKPLK